MCGFVGFIDFDHRMAMEQRKKIVEKMGIQIGHRGPDEQTFYYDDEFSLVFRRLSIVDLAGGSQPFWNEEHTMFVVANGEIYNHLELREKLIKKHRFRSNSDCEVIIHLYEDYREEALSLLNGIFAFAIWDTKDKRLFLARDRLGVKPLFYTKRNSVFLFGSELKALLLHPDCPRSPNIFDCGFNIWESSITRIYSLAGGTYLTISTSESEKLKRYWCPYDFVNYDDRRKRRPEEYIEEYAALLENSVKMQLMSDVPIGAFLSGGVDSCAVTAIAAKYNKGINCFNIIDKSFELNDDQRAAETLAKRENLPLYQLSLDDDIFTKMTLEDLEYYTWVLENPLLVSAETISKLVMYSIAKRVNPSLKVILLGQGADEFAGGYTKTAFLKDGKMEYTAKDWRECVEVLGISRMWKEFFTLINDDSIIDISYAYMNDRNQYKSGLERDNLWHVDRTSSSQSIEARVPFLDHRLVEFLVSIPSGYVLELFWDKNIERAACESFLPRSFVRRAKTPFILSPKGSENKFLTKGILQNLLTDFIEKYLDKPNALISKDKFLHICKKASSGDEKEKFLYHKTFSNILKTIFIEQCQHPEAYTHYANYVGFLKKG